MNLLLTGALCAGLTAIAATAAPVEPQASSEAELEAGLEGAAPAADAPANDAAGHRPDGPAVVPAFLVAQVGQTPAGLAGPITSLNSPFTNGLGQVGFVGAADDGGAGTDNFIWLDAGVLFLDSSVVGSTLTGGESTMGVGDAGQFIYSPAADGDDAVWTHNGLLLADGMPAPGFPGGTTITFNSRPQMLPGGQAYWVAGFNETGGTSTEGRMLYTSSDATPGTITVVMRSDDMVGGFPIARPSGIGFDYALSDDASHHIQSLVLDTGNTANDDAIVVDGVVAAREGSPTGDGDNWAGLDDVGINNPGDFLFSGDTSGAAGSDEFIAYNGTIAIREGDVLDGQTLTSPASVNALAINNFGHAVHSWSISGGAELLFFTCDAADLGASTLVLATGDQVDLDGNTVGDAAVTDFNASSVIGPGLRLAEDGFVFIEVDLDDGGGAQEAVIRLEVPFCGTPPTITVMPAALSSDQAPDEVVIQQLTVGNVGGADLEVTVGEAPADCALPSDVPWVSVSPAGDTIVSMGSTAFDVSFDSTGLAPGIYTGLLCLTSNDPLNPLVSVPLTLTVQQVLSVLEIPSLSQMGFAVLTFALVALGLLVLRNRRLLQQ